MSNLDALKALYTALGGEEDISGATTLVEILNAIARIGGGEGTATINAEAIAEIAANLPVPEIQNVGDGDADIEEPISV